MKIITYAVCLLFLISTVEAKPAQTNSYTPSSGFIAEFLFAVSEVEKKITDLAQAIPEEKYSWRPAEGVRSISEVYMHIAGSNFLFPRFIGIDPPGGLPPDMEKTLTEKGKVLEVLKQSFEHVRQAATKIPAADLDRKVKLFGRDSTVREVLITMSNHMHEHLGQSIAYARMNGIVPPWSVATETSR